MIKIQPLFKPTYGIKAMYRIMIRDNMSPVTKEILEATGKIEVVVDNEKARNAPERLIEIIGDFDGIAVTDNFD